MSVIRKIGAKVKRKMISDIARIDWLENKVKGLEWERDAERLRMHQYMLAIDKELHRIEMSKYNIESLPLISVVIPVYNGEKFVKDAINCALNQTYKNLEVIVVNDGSTDNTEKVVKSFGNRVRYFAKKNGGVSTALNYGIKKMKGEFFVWLSADDFIREDHVDNLARWAITHPKSVPYSRSVLVDENGDLMIDETVNCQFGCMNSFALTRENSKAALLLGEINGGAIMIPKEAFDKKGGFDEKLRTAQERNMWSRLLDDYDIVCLPFNSASIRVHKGQVTAKSQELIKKEYASEQMKIIKKHALSEKNDMKRRAFGRMLAEMYEFDGKFELSKAVKKEIGE